MSKLIAATIRGNRDHRTDLNSETDIIDARLSPLESVAVGPTGFNAALPFTSMDMANAGRSTR
jgi:hypothetical protein